MVRHRRLPDVEQRDQLADAHLAGVLAEHVDELQADRVATLDKLKTARKARFARITAAIDDRVPKAQVARELNMDRTNLYKLLDGKDEVVDARTD